MAKYKMADDFDDGDKGIKEEVAGSSQLENIINNIKSQMHSTNPAELARLSSNIDSFLTGNIPEKILESLKTIQAIVNERKERAEQNTLYSQEEKIREAAEEAKLQESIALLEKAANEKREEELKQHFDEYVSFQEDFHKQLKEERGLLDQAINNPNYLTPEQRSELLGQYPTKEKEEEAKKKQQEVIKRWKTHYAVKHKANESIKYRQGQIKANDAIINDSNTPESVRKSKLQDNVVHKQEIAKAKEKLTTIDPTEQDREAKRKQLLALVKSDQPELAIEILTKHHEHHVEEYDQARQEDPKHQGYHEFHSIIMALGGHEKLGLPKPNYPVQEQLVATPQNTKDSSVVPSQAESIECPVAHATQTLEEQVKAHAQSVRDSLEQSQLLPHQSNTKVKPKNSQPNIDAVVSKDQGQGKGETESASAKFAQRRKAMMAGHGGR